MAHKLPFHIQHNTTPKAVRTILTACAEEPDISAAALAQRVGVSLSSVQRRVGPFLQQMGLLNPNSFTLSEVGSTLYQLQAGTPSLFAEAVHMLLYTAHVTRPDKLFSWAYAKVVDALWMISERVLNGTVTAQLVGMIVDEAAQTFGVPVEKVAFSRKSVQGVLHWLRAMDPAIIQHEGNHETFHRRYFCPATPFLWAVDFLYRFNETPYGVRLFLSEERIEQVCKLCVLDPSGLDNVLALTKRTYDYERGGFFDHGTTGGFGRWVLLAKPFRLREAVSR